VTALARNLSQLRYRRGCRIRESVPPQVLRERCVMVNPTDRREEWESCHDKCRAARAEETRSMSGKREHHIRFRQDERGGNDTARPGLKQREKRRAKSVARVSGIRRGARGRAKVHGRGGEGVVTQATQPPAEQLSVHRTPYKKGRKVTQENRQQEQSNMLHHTQDTCRASRERGKGRECKT